MLLCALGDVGGTYGSVEIAADADDGHLGCVGAEYG